MKRNDIFVDVISALFIILFLYAALTKLSDYEKFRVQLGQSPLLTAFAGVVAWAVPAVEIVLSAMLFFRPTRLVALYGCFTLMVLFTAYITAILNFSDYVPCNCGGVLEKLGWKEHLVFNVGFVLLAAIGVLGHKEGNSSYSSTD